MSNNELFGGSSSSLRIGQELTANTLVGPHFRVIKRLGSGSFGDIYIGESLERKENDQEKRQVAIKLELAGDKTAQLFNEFKFYSIIGQRTGFPSIFWFGQWERFNVLAMDLLGKNLDDTFEACKRNFSLKTILQLAMQLLDRFEYLHSKRIVYRDVKPENFCLGRPGSSFANRVHVVDFGLSKEYADVNGEHIAYREGKSLTGTARYMSINTHLGIEQSRRDDLEALAHLFVYFLRKGKLPWSGLKAPNLKERYRKIGQVKQEMPVDELCADFPGEFGAFLKYARGLQFAEAPDYGQIVGSFEALYSKAGYEDVTQFDWNIK